MKKHLSLRIRVTIINTIVLIFCTLALTIGANISAIRTIDNISKESLMPSINDEIVLSQDVESQSNTDIKPAIYLTAAVKVGKQKLALTNTIYMIIVILLGTITTYLTTKKSLSKVKQLSDEIKNISEHNLSTKINEEVADDEIKDLTKSFNSMLSRIEDAFESQKRFSSNVAHELRTPLAVIKMKIDVFKKRNNPTKDDYEKLIEVIEKNNNRLSKVVDELLSICNKDSIDLKDNINFNTMINNICNDFKYVALEKNIKISVHGNIDSKFYGNEQLLYRAFYNLVENSVKYNVENGNVDIYLSNNSKYIKIQVKDTGIGIKEEDYENIFKPFYRIDKSRSRKIGGSGLGLSIVKTIIEQHNGKVKIESNDKGTTFLTEILYRY